MTLLTRLERKMGWMTIGGLPLYIVAAQGMVYIWSLFNPGQLHHLILDPRAVFIQGEYWRILTFLFVTSIQSPIFTFFYLYLLYIYGTALENEWGSFPFTLYYIVGALGTVAAALLFGSVTGAFYLNLTLFLAFAVLFPDFRIYLFFIIPVKIRWLAWLTWAGIGLSFVVDPVHVKAAILASLINYFLFFTNTHIENFKERIEFFKHRRRFKNWGQGE